VAAPATPSAGRPAQVWKRRSAASVRAPRPPSNVPDGKPRVASRNCRPATSHPRAFSESGRLPSRGRPLRAGDAVGGQAAAALEALDARGGGGPGDAVDGARVEAAGAQRDLQGGDVRGGGRRRGGRGEGEEGRDDQQADHTQAYGRSHTPRQGWA
jgi:hypothetical protein